MRERFDDRQAESLGEAGADQAMRLLVGVLQVGVRHVGHHEQALSALRMGVEPCDQFAGVPAIAFDETQLVVFAAMREALESAQHALPVLARLERAYDSEYPP